MIDALSSIEFRQPPLGLRQEHQALDRVLQRSVRRELLDDLKDLSLGVTRRHRLLLSCAEQHAQDNRIR